MSEQLNLFGDSTYSVEDFLARLSAWQEKGEGLTTPEGHSFLKSAGFSRTKNQNIFFSRTLSAYLVTEMEKLSRKYLNALPRSGISFHGGFLIANFSECPKTVPECSLWDVLEEEVSEEFFLSPDQEEGLRNQSQKNRWKKEYAARLHLNISLQEGGEEKIT